MSQDESEKLLYPSQWTKRFKSSEEAINYIETLGTKESAKHAKHLQKKDVRYGPGDRELLDIYFKDEEIGSPIVLFFHGGYWQEFEKEKSAFWITPYLEKGCRVILATYDLCPKVTLSHIIEEIERAMKFVLQYAAETQAKSVCIIGHSAGAHLVITALNKDVTKSENFHLVKAVFLLAGVYDTEILLDTSVNVNNILSLDRSNFAQLSPLRFNFDHLKGTDLPIYVCCGEHESPLFIEHSKLLATKLKDFGATVEYKCFNEIDHFNIAENLDKYDYPLCEILLKHLGK